jgi:mannose-6-phosphate isomerase-like protein (cupin superfamily)
MSPSVSGADDKLGELRPAADADLPEGPDTDVFVVRAASAPERLFRTDREITDLDKLRIEPDDTDATEATRFRFLATTVETAGRYSFLDLDIPVGGGPRPQVHQEADEWFYVLQGNAVFHVDYRTFPLAEGDFVHIPMGTTHWFEVLDARIRVLAGYSPAGEELRFL